MNGNLSFNLMMNKNAEWILFVITFYIGNHYLV